MKAREPRRDIVTALEHAALFLWCSICGLDAVSYLRHMAQL
jgi:hypothetical protein